MRSSISRKRRRRRSCRARRRKSIKRQGLGLPTLNRGSITMPPVAVYAEADMIMGFLQGDSASKQYTFLIKLIPLHQCISSIDQSDVPFHYLRPCLFCKFIHKCLMIAIGPSLRRKSFQRPEPTLPRAAPLREPSSNGRTAYRELKLPSQQLGEFSKRHLLTMGNLSTDKSLSRIHIEEQTMKQSRYDYDHHNTDSIAQLFEHKNDSNMHSTKQKLSEPQGMSEPEAKSSEGVVASQQKTSVEESLGVQREGQREEEGREGENYDDYVLGDQVEEEPQEKQQKIAKKYVHSHSTKTLTPYQSTSESELRLERQHILNERRRLAQINEDRQIAAMMAQYKNNKQQMLAHCARKHEAARILATIRTPAVLPENKIEKSLSLPVLKPKKEIIIPEDYYEERPVEPWKNTKNLLAKGLEKKDEEQHNLKLKYTLSYGKLGFGRKKVRTICQQDIQEQEMNSLEEIKSKLRAKGIMFDASKLKKGLLNQKNQPYDHSQLQCPDKRLPSNPIYKKFPL